MPRGDEPAEDQPPIECWAVVNQHGDVTTHCDSWDEAVRAARDELTTYDSKREGYVVETTESDIPLLRRVVHLVEKP